MTGDSRPGPSIGLRAAVGVQLTSFRTNALAVVVLAVGAVVWSLAMPHPSGQRIWASLATVFSASDWRFLLIALGGTLGLLIPISGVYSLVSQYAFWEGWLGGLPEPARLFAEAPRHGAGARPTLRRVLIYLDGIHQSELDHPVRVSAFLDALAGQLDPSTVLLRGVETYTLMPVRLAEDAGSTWFWQRVFDLQDRHPSAWIRFLCAFLVQVNNVIKVGISSDRRYGPIRHYELGLKIAMRLAELGFRPGCNVELVLIGYSGGAEMAMGVADYLLSLCRSPVRIATFCGVFSGNHRLNGVEAVTTVVGSRDPVAALGNIAYPGRMPLFPLSGWNRARQRQLVTRETIPGMNHNGDRGPFSIPYRDVVIQALIRAIGPVNPI